MTSSLIIDFDRLSPRIPPKPYSNSSGPYIEQLSGFHTSGVEQRLRGSVQLGRELHSTWDFDAFFP